MRLVPQSITGRLIAVLIAGLLVTLLASVAVLSLTQPKHGEARNFPSLVGQIIGIVSVINRTPLETRPAVIDSIEEPGLEFRWSPAQKPELEDPRHKRARRMERELQHALGLDVIAFRHRGDIDAWVRLDDGTWLSIELDEGVFGEGWFLRIIAALAVFTLGIGLLATWAARRVTAPLRQFSAAAERLGTDVNAPPLPEKGAA